MTLANHKENWSVRLCTVQFSIIVVIALVLALFSSAVIAQETAEEERAQNVAEAVSDLAVNEAARDADTGLLSEVLNPDIPLDELELRLIH